MKTFKLSTTYFTPTSATLFFVAGLAMSLGILISGTSYADTPSTHGMLLFGSKSTYASHLPMFHAPHDYQLILKLSIKDLAGSGALAAYELQKSKGETLFTIEPETMDLTHVISGAKSSFSAHLYIGHFERGGKDVGLVKVQVEKIVFSSKLNPRQTPTTTDGYLIFGEKGEYYATHLIREKPSFDIIATATLPYSLRARVKLPISDSKLPVVIQEPKTDGIAHAGSSLGDPSSPLRTDILKVIYVEEAELSH